MKNKALVVIDLQNDITKNYKEIIENVNEAVAILDNVSKAGALPIKKVVLSAAANAEHNLQMNAADLYVAECYADQGPTLKRIRPRAQGRAYRINKKTSHITLVLKEAE